MRLIVTLGFIVLCIAGIACGADPQNIDKIPPPGVNPPLTPTEFVWFYGYIPAGTWVCHNYGLTNNRKDTVTITQLVPGCDCTQVPKTPIKIAPGETTFIKVQFDTKTYSGETNRDVHVITDYKENPAMDLYFASMIGVHPRTVSIDPPSTVFIAGKDYQTFKVSNLIDESTEVRIIIDNDSTLSVSESTFTLKGKEAKEFTISPLWDKLTYGPSYNCVIVEFIRKEVFRVSIPVKTNRF